MGYFMKHVEKTLGRGDSISFSKTTFNGYVSDTGRMYLDIELPYVVNADSVSITSMNGKFYGVAGLICDTTNYATDTSKFTITYEISQNHIRICVRDVGSNFSNVMNNTLCAYTGAITVNFN